MSEQLTEIAGVQITVTGVSVGITVLTLLLMMVWWLLDRKKRTGRAFFAGQVMNGIGFGLLPALAVWKALEELGRSHPGTEVPEPLPQTRWLCDGGRYVPVRIEMAAALVCFFLICFWLILRKEALPDNGDLLLISVCLWAGIRLVTEGFRAEPERIYRYASCSVILSAVILWAVRRSRIYHMPGRTAVW